MLRSSKDHEIAIAHVIKSCLSVFCTTRVMLPRGGQRFFCMADTILVILCTRMNKRFIENDATLTDCQSLHIAQCWAQALPSTCMHYVEVSMWNHIYIYIYIYIYMYTHRPLLLNEHQDAYCHHMATSWHGTIQIQEWEASIQHNELNRPNCKQHSQSLLVHKSEQAGIRCVHADASWKYMSSNSKDWCNRLLCDGTYLWALCR